MKQDRNFDDLSHRFKRKIYGSPKGTVRLEVVWEDLLACLPALQGAPLRILDAGAGMGQIALRLAKLGHEVVLCDHSLKMLQLAQHSFAAELPAANVQFIHAPVQRLHEHLEGQFDLVPFHAVLEWLAEPETTLPEVLRWCRPTGALSLLFYNHHALTYLNLIKGNLRTKSRRLQARWQRVSMKATRAVSRPRIHRIPMRYVAGWRRECG